MSMFEMIITPDDGGEPIEIEAGMRDVRIWEKMHRGRALATHLGEGMKAEYVFELAYSACRRQGKIADGVTEEQFIDTHELDLLEPGDIAKRRRALALKQQIVEAPELTAEADEADPTRPGVSPGQ